MRTLSRIIDLTRHLSLFLLFLLLVRSSWFESVGKQIPAKNNRTGNDNSRFLYAIHLWKERKEKKKGIIQADRLLA